MPIPASTKPRLHLRRLGVAGALAAACALTACTAPANVARKPAPAYAVVADHLANPRGLFIAKGSTDLYFTEAGLGGGTAKTGVQLGAGHSGRVSIVRGADAAHPRVQRLASTLWSSAEVEDRLDTVGPAGLTTSDGSLYVVVSEEFGDHLGARPQEGRLLKVTGSGVTAVADLATAALRWEALPANVDRNSQFPDTNPYDVTADAVGPAHDLYVADAAANTVERVDHDGHVTVIAYLPDTPMADAIPTCIQQGPDGALYVGTLAYLDGPRAARIYRVDPTKHLPVLKASTVWATGLTAINGCAFSPDGKYLYVSEFEATETSNSAALVPPAAVVKVPVAHPGSGRSYLGLSVLHFAGDVAVDRNGHVYVANHTNQDTGAPIGQVLRLNR